MVAVAPNIGVVVDAAAPDDALTVTACDPPAFITKLDGAKVTFATTGATMVIGPVKFVPFVEKVSAWLAPPGESVMLDGATETVKSCVEDGGGPPCRVTFQLAEPEPGHEGTPGIEFRLKFTVPLPFPSVPSVPLAEYPIPPGADDGALMENDPPLLTTGPDVKVEVVSKSAEHPDPVIRPPNTNVVIRFELTVMEIDLACTVVPLHVPSHTCCAERLPLRIRRKANARRTGTLKTRMASPPVCNVRDFVLI